MKKLFQSPFEFWSLAPKRLRMQVTGALLLFTVLLAICCAAGCAATSAGIAREERIYTIATNAVAHAQQIAPVLPAPANTIAETVLALAAAGLAAWNTAQHRQIKNLQNGKTINGTAVASASKAPPA